MVIGEAVIEIDFIVSESSEDGIGVFAIEDSFVID